MRMCDIPDTSSFGLGRTDELQFEISKLELNGDSASKLSLGLLYIKGVPGELQQDVTMGIQYMTQSADLGNADACYALSLVYKSGSNSDLSKAKTWLERAVANGKTSVQSELNQ